MRAERQPLVGAWGLTLRWASFALHLLISPACLKISQHTCTTCDSQFCTQPTRLSIPHGMNNCEELARLHSTGRLYTCACLQYSVPDMFRASCLARTRSRREDLHSATNIRPLNTGSDTTSSLDKLANKLPTFTRVCYAFRGCIAS